MNILPDEISLNIYEEINSVVKDKSLPLDKVIALKRTFKRIFAELTNNEEISFYSVQARIEYVISVHELEQPVSDKISRLKNFIFRVINKKIEFSKSDLLAFVSELSLLTYELSDTPIPDTLQLIVDKHSPVIKPKEIESSDEYLNSIKCVVLNISSVNTEEIGKEHFSVLCESTNEDFRFSLRVYSFHFDDFKKLHKNLRRYQTLRILNIKSYIKEKHLYTSISKSQIIIEPDFLIEASEIAECFSGFSSNPNIFFVRKLIPSIIGEGAFRGTLVNGLMDKLILNADINPADALLELIKESPLKACAIGTEGINNIISEVLSIHYPNLLKIFKERKHSQIKIEPSFLSPIYGISGRLDALIIPEKNADHKNVFELKSGKPPANNNIWPNNKMQLVCYNLLMKSTFGNDRKGITSVLYSSAKQSPFRAVAISPNDEKRVLSIRNSIISDIFKLQENTFDILYKFLHADIGVTPVFSKNDIIEFSNLLKEASILESKYYRYNLAFALREFISSKIGSNRFSDYSRNGFSSLWLDTIEEKEKDYSIINNLELIKYNVVDDTIEFTLPGSTEHNFRDGDFIIIYKKTNDEPNPLSTELFRGKIKTISNHSVVIELHNKQLDQSYYSPGSFWVIEHDIVESNVWGTIQSLYDFLRAPTARKELLLGIREPQFENIHYINEENLSDDQNDNVRKAVSAKDYFLLQGPPGSGKTSTALICIVRNLVKLYKILDKKIVVLAYTNRAVEEICIKLNDNGINFLKIGGKSVSESYDLNSSFSVRNLDEIREIISEKDVYVSTVSSFYGKMYDLKEIADLDTVIVDEASQLTDYTIAGILCNFKKFIMIGDQNQLPAVITQSKDSCVVKDIDLNNAGIRDFSQSLFERLYLRCKEKKWGNAYGMLQTHYRLHKDISALINGLYFNKLRTGREEQVSKFLIFDTKSEDEIEKLLSSSRLIFIDCDYEKVSKINLSEAVAANKILETIKRVYGKEFSKRTVGVVTPWRAQIALIRKQIKDKIIREEVNIDTVERFQGSERDIIIISLAVHNSYQLKNLESFNAEGIDRKLLVSISRGSKQLIILGNSKVLEKGRYYKEIIEHIKEKGLYINQKQRKKAFGI
ncbi:MAG: ATP-binding protein [Candidatus Kapaibacterium sp.]